MAYSAPELLLVGAAQNLVLAASGDEKVGDCFREPVIDVDPQGDEYNTVPTW